MRSIAAANPFAENTERISISLEISRAIFVSSDVQAIGFPKACNEAGIAIPEKLVIMSLDGIRASAFTTSGL